jgi:hypothetical protein
MLLFNHGCLYHGRYQIRRFSSFQYLGADNDGPAHLHGIHVGHSPGHQLAMPCLTPYEQLPASTHAKWGRYTGRGTSYTALAWVGLRNHTYTSAEMANFVLPFGMIGFASSYMWKSKLCGKLVDTIEPHECASHKPGSTSFHISYLMVFFGLILWPTFAVVLVSHPPFNQFPEYGTYLLFATFGTAIASHVSAFSTARSRLLPSFHQDIRVW